ncbi:hypothetical protein TCAL_09753 [Tigriopus californicus]|uniref:BTB domain-containing protein n=1 Tax=Tigriopus californicus TaxID=6832 RepID=A0A553PCK1_TIGCA|nr:zinc finger protein 718-like [Tigriopus californicus]TRY75403.1 hypothetical protein TCAL_09753 [Tigriopus californicus]|eukprot:TCALIF_09753-PA protein Name:"Similar to ZNF782 Zinc finger protein 782 (Homo sapiens)" AED:0.10 eAED:0.10 QI:0/-1/0/1/-1/1/1/228/421
MEPGSYPLEKTCVRFVDPDTSHGNHLWNGFRQARCDQQFLDVRLISAEGVSLHTHAFLLASASSLFRHLLSLAMPTDSVSSPPISDDRGLISISLPDVSTPILAQVIDLLYEPWTQRPPDLSALGVDFLSFHLPPPGEDTQESGQAMSIVSQLSNDATQSVLLRWSKDPLPKNFLAHRDSVDMDRDSMEAIFSKLYQCPTCGKGLKSMSALSQHKQIHLPKAPDAFKCGICHVSFGTRRYLYQHNHRKHQAVKAFECEVCHRVLGGAEALRGHMRLHSGAKPYQCLLCQRSFRNRSTLNNHKKAHSQTRPQVCGQCGKAFVQKGDLRKHMRTHTHEKPFKCETCGRCFARTDYLKKHKRVHVRSESDLEERQFQLKIDLAGEEISCSLMDESILTEPLSGLPDELVLDSGHLDRPEVEKPV